MKWVKRLRNPSETGAIIELPLGFGEPVRSTMDEMLPACYFSSITSALSQIDFSGLTGSIPSPDLSQGSAYTDAAKRLGEAASAVSGDAAKGMGGKLAAVCWPCLMRLARIMKSSSLPVWPRRRIRMIKCSRNGWMTACMSGTSSFISSIP